MKSKFEIFMNLEKIKNLRPVRKRIISHISYNCSSFLSFAKKEKKLYL